MKQQRVVVRSLWEPSSPHPVLSEAGVCSPPPYSPSSGAILVTAMCAAHPDHFDSQPSQPLSPVALFNTINMNNNHSLSQPEKSSRPETTRTTLVSVSAATLLPASFVEHAQSTLLSAFAALLGGGGEAVAAVESQTNTKTPATCSSVMSDTLKPTPATPGLVNATAGMNIKSTVEAIILNAHSDHSRGRGLGALLAAVTAARLRGDDLSMVIRDHHAPQHRHDDLTAASARVTPGGAGGGGGTTTATPISGATTPLSAPTTKTAPFSFRHECLMASTSPLVWGPPRPLPPPAATAGTAVAAAPALLHPQPGTWTLSGGDAGEYGASGEYGGANDGGGGDDDDYLDVFFSSSSAATPLPAAATEGLHSMPTAGERGADEDSTLPPADSNASPAPTATSSHPTIATATSAALVSLIGTLPCVVVGALLPLVLRVASQPLLEYGEGPAAIIVGASPRQCVEIAQVLAPLTDALELVCHCLHTPNTPNTVVYPTQEGGGGDVESVGGSAEEQHYQALQRALSAADGHSGSGSHQQCNTTTPTFHTTPAHTTAPQACLHRNALGYSYSTGPRPLMPENRRADILIGTAYAIATHVPTNDRNDDDDRSDGTRRCRHDRLLVKDPIQRIADAILQQIFPVDFEGVAEGAGVGSPQSGSTCHHPTNLPDAHPSLYAQRLALALASGSIPRSRPLDVLSPGGSAAAAGGSSVASVLQMQQEQQQQQQEVQRQFHHYSLRNVCDLVIFYDHHNAATSDETTVPNEETTVVECLRRILGTRRRRYPASQEQRYNNNKHSDATTTAAAAATANAAGATTSSTSAAAPNLDYAGPNEGIPIDCTVTVIETGVEGGSASTAAAGVAGSTSSSGAGLRLFREVLYPSRQAAMPTTPTTATDASSSSSPLFTSMTVDLPLATCGMNRGIESEQQSSQIESAAASNRHHAAGFKRPRDDEQPAPSPPSEEVSEEEAWCLAVRLTLRHMTTPVRLAGALLKSPGASTAVLDSTASDEVVDSTTCVASSVIDFANALLQKQHLDERKARSSVAGEDIRIPLFMPVPSVDDDCTHPVLHEWAHRLHHGIDMLSTILQEVRDATIAALDRTLEGTEIHASSGIQDVDIALDEHAFRFTLDTFREEGQHQEQSKYGAEDPPVHLAASFRLYFQNCGGHHAARDAAVYTHHEPLTHLLSSDLPSVLADALCRQFLAAPVDGLCPTRPHASVQWQRGRRQHLPQDAVVSSSLSSTVNPLSLSLCSSQPRAAAVAVSEASLCVSLRRLYPTIITSIASGGGAASSASSASAPASVLRPVHLPWTLPAETQGQMMSLLLLPKGMPPSQDPPCPPLVAAVASDVLTNQLLDGATISMGPQKQQHNAENTAVEERSMSNNVNAETETHRSSSHFRLAGLTSVQAQLEQYALVPVVGHTPDNNICCAHEVGLTLQLASWGQAVRAAASLSGQRVPDPTAAHAAWLHTQRTQYHHVVPALQQHHRHDDLRSSSEGEGECNTRRDDKTSSSHGSEPLLVAVRSDPSAWERRFEEGMVATIAVVGSRR